MSILPPFLIDWEHLALNNPLCCFSLDGLMPDQCPKITLSSPDNGYDLGNIFCCLVGKSGRMARRLSKKQTEARNPKLLKKAARFAPAPSVGSSNLSGHIIVKPVIMGFDGLFPLQMFCPRVLENLKQSQTTTKNPEGF